MTTYLDDAYHILHQAGQPLRYEEITERALAQQLISPQGLTPEATMASRLYTDTLQQGSRFTRVDKGAFGLVDWRPAGIEAKMGIVEKNLKVISLDDEWWGELAGPAAPAPAMAAPEHAPPVDLPETASAGHGKPRAAARKPVSFAFLGQPSLVKASGETLELGD